MKANTTVTKLSNGHNTKGEETSPFGHTLNSMGGIIDVALCSGKFVGLQSLLITLNTVKGNVTSTRRKTQNTDDVTMTAMKIKPHLQWLCRKGGLQRCIAVFGEKQGTYRHGLAAHAAGQLLEEMKGMTGAA